MSAQFSRTANPAPLPHAQRGGDPGRRPGSAGTSPTTWSRSAGPQDRAGTTRRCVPYGPLTLDPATMVLHYGQEIFEGLKAYRQPDGSIASFRPGRQRRAVPRARRRGWRWRELPDELFLASIAELLDVDREWVPAGGRRGRRCTCGRSCWPPRSGWACGPSAEYLYCLIASPGRAVLPGRREARRRVAVHGVHARGARAAPARPSAAATTRPRCSRRPRAPSTAARRWSTSTPRSTAGSTRWARTTCSSSTARASRSRS